MSTRFIRRNWYRIRRLLKTHADAGSVTWPSLSLSHSAGRIELRMPIGWVVRGEINVCVLDRFVSIWIIKETTDGKHPPGPYYKEVLLPFPVDSSQAVAQLEHGSLVINMNRRSAADQQPRKQIALNVA